LAISLPLHRISPLQAPAPDFKLHHLFLTPNSIVWQPGMAYCLPAWHGTLYVPCLSPNMSALLRSSGTHWLISVIRRHPLTGAELDGVAASMAALTQRYHNCLSSSKCPLTVGGTVYGAWTNSEYRLLPPPPKVKVVMFSPLSVCLSVCLFY